MTNPTKGSVERLPTRARGALAKRDSGGLVARGLADWRRLQSARTSSAAEAEAIDEEWYRQAKAHLDKAWLAAKELGNSIDEFLDAITRMLTVVMEEDQAHNLLERWASESDVLNEGTGGSGPDFCRGQPEASAELAARSRKRVEWEDLGFLRQELFHVWAFGGDIEWAETAWRRLAGAGLTEYTGENARRAVLIRFFTLACIYNSFCIEVFEEGYDFQDLSYSVEVSDLLPVEDSEDSAVDGGLDSTVEQGEDGDESSDGDYESEDDDQPYESLRSLVGVEHPKLVAALAKAFGGEWPLFGYMWISCNWTWQGTATEGDGQQAAFGLTSEQIENRIHLLLSAGKTTVMQMLTGYLAPSGGNAGGDAGRHSGEIPVAPEDDEILDLHVDEDEAIVGAGWIENGCPLRYYNG